MRIVAAAVAADGGGGIAAAGLQLTEVAVASAAKQQLPRLPDLWITDEEVRVSPMCDAIMQQKAVSAGGGGPKADRGSLYELYYNCITNFAYSANWTNTPHTRHLPQPVMKRICTVLWYEVDKALDKGYGFPVTAVQFGGTRFHRANQSGAASLMYRLSHDALESGTPTTPNSLFVLLLQYLVRELLQSETPSSERLTDLLFIACSEGDVDVWRTLLKYDAANTRVLASAKAVMGGSSRKRKDASTQQQQQQQQDVGQLLEQLLLTCLAAGRHDIMQNTVRPEGVPAVSAISECQLHLPHSQPSQYTILT